MKRGKQLDKSFERKVRGAYSDMSEGAERVFEVAFGEV